MKKIVLVCLILSSLSLSAQEKAIIGMTITEVNRVYPGIKKDSNENGITLSRPVKLYGLEGYQGYRFKDSKLYWIFFDKYINNITAENFNLCLSATNNLIRDFTVQYGQPDTLIKGDTTFKDPNKVRHWGYDVLEARWKDFNNMKIKVEFTFMGGKGQYSFLVKISYFDKLYPYYD
jgi:hypothetical protein